MKSKLLLIPVIATAVLLGPSCANRKVTRIDPNQQTDISGRWNDTDSKLVANEMIKDVLERPWRSNFEQKHGRKPVVIIGSVKNKSTEQIDPITFIKDLEKSFINSGVVGVVQSGDERNQVRDERNDQQTFSSEDTKKKWGREKGADFMLNGVVASIVDQYKNQKTVAYQVTLELTDLETNEKVWIGEKEIKKYIKN
jgi:penicillin-binding protein activator